MKKTLLASVAALALFAAAPVLAADDNHDRHGRHGGGGHHDGTPDATPAAPAATPAAPQATTPPPGAPAMIPGTPILAQPPAGDGHADRGGDHHGTGGAATNGGAPTGTDTHGRHDNDGRDNNGGANAGGPFGTDRGGHHSGRNHNDGFDALRRAFNAPRHYRHGRYHRPHGWYAHRWSFGEFLPSLFFSSRSYWISDYSDYDLPYPPPGTRWVRYGDDALLIDRYNGEIIQVVYGIFY